jgi:hypothetical protein
LSRIRFEEREKHDVFPAAATDGLEPIVRDASPISGQVFKLVESIKMVNRNLGHGLWCR